MSNIYRTSNNHPTSLGRELEQACENVRRVDRGDEFKENVPNIKFKGIGYTTMSLLLVNAIPFLTWIIMSGGSGDSWSILTVLPLLQMAATIFAGVMNVMRCLSLKRFNMFMGILLVSSVGGAYLSGLIWYYFVSSDWLTLPMTYLYMIVFAITVGVIALIGNIIIIQNIKHT